MTFAQITRARTGFGALLALVLAVGVSTAPAQAAPAPHSAIASSVKVAAAKKVTNKVTITKLKNKKVAYGKKATFKPAAKTTGHIKISAKTLTVKQGKKTVAKNKKSVKLKAGTYKITTTVKYKVGTAKKSGSKTKIVYKGKVKTKKLTQTIKVTQGKKPNRVYGNGGYNCPAGYPVKGNASSMIYHVPGGAFYSRTKPEECFKDASAARAAGYRASKR